MKTFNLRIALLIAFCAVAVLSLLWVPTGQDNVLAIEADVEAPAETLAVGSPAPKLDIEHWIQDGNGFFKAVTDFKKGNVYVVEFWATWCGPCISSMPHLAELQNKYRGENVQIISVSDEPLETVEEFLKREADGKDGGKTTFAEITSAYSLTTDPDQSTYEAYMVAAQQRGIPTAFLIGKDGVIEWIGHPMEMDEPLASVVSGSWDRVAYAKAYAERQAAQEAFATTLQKASQLANAGKFAEAAEVVETELAKELPDQIRMQLTGIKYEIKLMGGIIDEEMLTVIRERIASSQGDLRAMVGIGSILYQITKDPKKDHPEVLPLIDESIASIKKELETAEDGAKAMLLDTLAHLQEGKGDLDAAIETQQSAIESADPRLKDRLTRYLDQLNEAKAAPAEAEESEEK
jgi:thiol-disulfide isomerase/thioredoxin